MIDALSEAVQRVPGCTLIDVDPGASTNRTVYTFVGEADAVIDGGLAMARVARERIDMRAHTGEHPRFGAMDVCPFVPVRGVSMEDCVAISKEFGERVASELGVPVYLYEEAVAAGSDHDHRRRLPDVRAGEYEALACRITEPNWRPDFGPASFVPEWGATATGARKFLIAYNVNLLGTKQQVQHMSMTYES